MIRNILRTTLLVLALILPGGAHAAFPQPTGFVNDFAGVISGATRGHLESLLSSFEKATGNEVAVATLPSLDGRVIEELAPDLYKQWGIGKKGKDNGVLFLIAPNERKARIEVGYGLESVINDALAGRLLDENVLPRFKAGDLDGGIAAGTAAIVDTIVAKEGISFDVEASFGGSVSFGSAKGKGGGPLDTAFKILILIVMIYLFIRHPWLFLLFLSSGRGGGGGGGFGGGFGGFGGGFSGGGGASRGW
jgi:uncharacterized protein